MDLQDPPPPGARTSRGLHVAVAHPDVPAPPPPPPPTAPSRASCAPVANYRSQARRVAERGFDRERARVHRSIVTTREFVSFCRTTTRAPTSSLRYLRLYSCITVGIAPRIRRTELYDRVTYTAAVTPVVLVLTVLESAELGVKPRNSYFCAEKSGSTEHGTGYLRVSPAVLHGTVQTEYR